MRKNFLFFQDRGITQLSPFCIGSAVLTITDNKISIRIIRDPLPSHLSIVVVDETFSLAFEPKDIDRDEFAKEQENSADTMRTTLGIYSNNESIALTYHSIFEKLWIQNEMYSYATKGQPNNKQ